MNSIPNARTPRDDDPQGVGRTVDFTPINPASLDRYTSAPSATQVGKMIAANPAGTARLLTDIRQARPVHPARTVRRIIDLTALGLAVALGLSVAPITAPTAQAATVQSTATMGAGLNLKAGPHHPISLTLHAGDWIIDGKPVTCVTYGLATGAGPLTAGAPIGMPDAESAKRAAYITNVSPSTLRVVTGSSLAADKHHVAAWRWFSLADLIAAKPGAQATAQARVAASNLRLDLPGYRAQISAADRAAIAAILTASNGHGPYRVSVTAPKAVPGTTVASVVTVVGANGSPAAGIPVTVTASGARLSTASVTTDKAGRATVRTTPAALTYTVGVRASVPLADVLRTPVASGRQSMIGGRGYGTITGSACATVCPVKARVTVAAECAKPALKSLDVTWTVEDLPGTYRGVITVGGARSQVALTPGDTRTTTTTAKAGQDVTVGWEILAPATGAVLASDTLATVTVR